MLQINDIRYDIFHLVMVYLYNGGSRPLRPQVEAGDVLELMAAANFFQLPGMLRMSMKSIKAIKYQGPLGDRRPVGEKSWGCLQEICLEGKSMTPFRAKTLLSLQLPGLRFEPLEGLLS